MVYIEGMSNKIRQKNNKKDSAEIAKKTRKIITTYNLSKRGTSGLKVSNELSIPLDSSFDDEVGETKLCSYCITKKSYK